MPYCAVANCKNHSGEKNLANAGVSYHRFPSDPEIADKWIEATGRTDWTPYNTSTICSDHFDDKARLLGTKFGELAYNAIPTIRLPVDADSVYDVPDSESDASVDEQSKSQPARVQARITKLKEVNDKQRTELKKLRMQRIRDLKKIKLQNRVLNDLMEIYNLKHGDIAILKAEILKTEEFKNSCMTVSQLSKP